jgi:cytidylate kinase
VIVTISNEYGAGALEVAKGIADGLGYEYVDHQLPIVVAKRLRVTPAAVEANEDAVPSLGERFLTGLERATPELAEASAAEPFDEELLAAVQDAVREYASHGNVVIVGRGASAILGPRPDVLRVFVRAPREWRIAHVAETMAVTRETAESEVDRIDRARSAYIRDWYGLTFGDSQNYDLCLDASRLGTAQSAALVIAAVRSAGAVSF